MVTSLVSLGALEGWKSHECRIGFDDSSGQVLQRGIGLIAVFVAVYVGSGALVGFICAVPTNDMAVMISKDWEASQDPINAFMVDMFVHYNFDAAEKRIASMSFGDDYYLASHEAQLQTAAKSLVDQIKQRLYQ